MHPIVVRWILNLPNYTGLHILDYNFGDIHIWIQMKWLPTQLLIDLMIHIW